MDDECKVCVASQFRLDFMISNKILIIVPPPGKPKLPMVFYMWSPVYHLIRKIFNLERQGRGECWPSGSEFKPHCRMPGLDTCLWLLAPGSSFTMMKNFGDSSNSSSNWVLATYSRDLDCFWLQNSAWPSFSPNSSCCWHLEPSQ